MKKLVCSLALICGCSSGPAWHVDARFSATERAAIQQAADTWTTPVDLVFGARVTAFDTDRRVIVRVDRTTLEVASPSTRDLPKVHAVTQDELRILLEPDTMLSPLWYITAHEIGHGMGLKHVEDPAALMYYTSTEESRGCVTETDAGEYYRVNGVRIRTGCQ